MKIRTIKFYLKEGAVSLFKNRLMTIASIGTICACIFLFIVSICSIANVNTVLGQIEASVGVSVFPDDDISDEDLKEMERKLGEIPNVTKVRYIPPDEALRSMEEDFAENKEVLEGFEKDNPLPKSFEIKVNSAQNTKLVIAEIKKLDYVRKIKEAEQLVSFLINLSNALSIVGVLVVIILSAISVVIVVNTIKLTVYVRRKEINIMKFVGATDWFIRWPFIIEGAFIGIIGAVIPSAIMWIVYSRIIEKVSEVPMLSGFFTLLTTTQIFPILAPVCLAAGAVLGTSGSVYSVRKHLNV